MNDELSQAVQKLGPRAQEALEIALKKATAHGFLGVEHLVLGLLEIPELVQRIQNAGVDSAKLVSVAQGLLQELQIRINLGPGEVPPCSLRVAKLLCENAPRIAKRRGHMFVEPDDILIAVLQEEGIPLVERLQENINVPQFLERLEYAGPPPLTIPEPVRSWCHDLTARAQCGELIPLIDREREIEQVIRILLTPMGPANPVLVGEAGVGKTAIVEGLAQRIVAGKDQALRDMRIVQVDMNAMLAGTFLRGTFEANLKMTIEFAKRRPGAPKIVLFIDELHSIVGAGRALGVPADAAQVLLGPLSRGEIQVIGTTTIEQYEEYIAQDPALNRRFAMVKVEEPNLEETREILRSLRPTIEGRFRTHGMEVHFTDPAIDAALDFSQRYLLSQRLPDKPLRWVVAAGVRCHREGKDTVTPEDVRAVVSETTGIPEDILFRSTGWTPEYWIRVLRARVLGQDHVINEVAHRVLANLGPLRADKHKPIAVFLFAGPTGVGKTELAKALTELLFGDEERMVRLDMSEFHGEGGVQRLIGPPRGIVGAGRGELTDRVRYHPYTVVLLDEFEKADPLVRALFLQVFDEGWLADGLGRRVYFTDTIIIATTNLGAEEYLKRAARRPSGFSPPELLFSQEADEAERIFKRAIEEKFPPELVNRFSAICIFHPLSRQTLEEIARLELERLKERLHRATGKNLSYSPEAVALLAQHGLDPRFGARALKRALEQLEAYELGPCLSEADSFRIEIVEEGGQQKLTVVREEEVGG
jgi:ATP-dependent Clp protease ATP-binding subunit ClpA